MYPSALGRGFPLAQGEEPIAPEGLASARRQVCPLCQPSRRSRRELIAPGCWRRQ